ncbi:hypothetical protein LJC68_01190 [Bacteroidales bacterium OttesenSCG-928-B11]|nr:hypothetical protein [Bacteroidales bacterium OttesenSCG-928-E04]MDL2308167.1 hypothetical protein [Bacteroidales bacterium OttesenSCG-928-C03]MDL2311478.1 hypothetical protein [Bacteroidales bacterium OttesenSCG-928-B11]MDL2325593.1 hypothetical protein [Bacteroidales bacterium OttesenSCG-928-A14]
MLFRDVMVDENIKKQLINQVKSNRISHAQLFLSQPGGEGFALAVAYAQYLSCSDKQEHDSCGVCPSCQKYIKLAHPDLHLYFPNAITKDVKKDPDSRQFTKEFIQFVQNNNYHINLDDWLSHLDAENKQASINIRDCVNIIEENGNRSYEGGYKVFILWMVERLFHSAAPKLLKTLEEPERNTLFVLISENPDKILTTIQSRAQLIKLPKLSEEMIAQQLMQEYSISHEVARDIAVLSDGNYHLALSLFQDQGEMGKLQDYCAKLLDSLNSFVTTANKTHIDFIGVNNVFQEIVGGGRENQKQFIGYLLSLFRKMLLHNTHNNPVLKLTEKEKALLASYANLITLRNITPIVKECNEAIYHIERNGNSNIIFNDLYLKLAEIMKS